jgi:dihydrofolate synthase/folylpolyglutamate synthase
VVESLASELPVTSADIANGLAASELRGRLERRLRGGVEWIFDVAHNPAAARVLRLSLDELPTPARTFAVFGAMFDKDIAGVLQQFAELVSEWHVAQVDTERGASLASLLEQVAALGRGPAYGHHDVASACAAAEAAARPGDRVVVFGSFYTVGPAMAALGLYSTPA